MPVNDIEDSVMSWLVEAYEPEGMSDRYMEEETQLKNEGWKLAKRHGKPQGVDERSALSSE